MDNTLDFLDSVGATANRRSFPNILPPKPSKKKEVGLVRWRIAFSASTRGTLFPDVALQVEGIRIDNGESWTSSEILEVDIPTTIHTANTIYQLVGKIDSRICLERGMPHEFIEKFTTGFPADWKEGINEFINFLFQHAGRQRISDTHEKENQEEYEPTIDFASNDNLSTHSPNRIADFQSENSSIFEPQSPLPAILSPISPKTPSPKNRLSFAHVTVRRTNNKKSLKRSIESLTPPTINRSKRGRVLKPRLAPGERIVYDCYGSPIGARKDATRTHISNNSSIEFDSICKTLNLERADSPTQTEKRLSNVSVNQSKRRTITRKSLAKLLAYDKSIGEGNYLDTLDERNEIDEAELSPIVLKKPSTRRFIASDDESDHNDISDEEELKPKKLVKSKPVKSKSVKPKPVKSKTANKREKPKKVKSKTNKSKPVKDVEPTTPVTRSQSTLILPTPSPLKPTPAKPKRKIWGAKDKRDLQNVFFAFNPCNDKDWERVVEALPVEWSVEEVKQQAKKMKFAPLALVDKNKTPKVTAIEKIRQLIPDGKLPQKGTIRREALEEEVLQQLFVKRNGNEEENILGATLDDSDDMFIREAMQSHALDNIHATETNNKFSTPSKRAYFPKAISACRRRSSIAAVNSIGDDFSLPDRRKMKYRLKFRAQQFNRRQNGMNSIKEFNDSELQDSSDLPEANESIENEDSFA